MKTITSKSGRKILLREPRESDVEIMMDFMNEVIEEDVMILVNEKQMLEEEQKYMKGALKDIAEKKMVKIFAFDGEALIGQCDVRKGKYRSAHVGVFGIIIRRGYRGDGIARQLSDYVLQLAKERLGVSLVELHVYNENEAARKLYERLGFVECGVLPGAVQYQGRFIDQIHMYKKL